MRYWNVCKKFLIFAKYQCFKKNKHVSSIVYKIVQHSKNKCFDFVRIEENNHF